MQIVAFSGKKQSGKNSSIQYLTANAASLWPGCESVKTFSFAGPLKQFAISILGLEPRQVYGTDDDKNSLTRYRWGDLPNYGDVAGRIMRHNHERDEQGVPKHWRWAKPDPNGTGVQALTIKEYLPSYQQVPGPKDQMTARQVLQEVGTGMLRQMWSDIWAEACIREIKKWNGDVAFIDDCRFPNEVSVVQEAGGIVLRLSRDVFKGQDCHDSERALDPDRFGWTKFDGVVFNDEIDLDAQNTMVVSMLADLGVIETVGVA